MAETEIEQFRREIIERTRDATAGDKIDDATLLREVMNTVGKVGKLGEQIRCVVSVSMLTEGWDANTVTHILGVRAFGTQLLCEQVVGRGLRRQSYDLNEESLFNVEYADILGIPFDFAAKPVIAPVGKPRETVRVHAVRPDRDALEIQFPRVEGYRVELPEERLDAKFGPDFVLHLTPDLVGPSRHQEPRHHRRGRRFDPRTSQGHAPIDSAVPPDPAPALQQVSRPRRRAQAAPVRPVEAHHAPMAGGRLSSVLRAEPIRRSSATANLPTWRRERIKAAITDTLSGERPVKAILDAYNPTGSTRFVNFTTSKETRWQTDPRKCHVNWVVCDSDWEAEFCRVAEAIRGCALM